MIFYCTSSSSCNIEIVTVPLHTRIHQLSLSPPHPHTHISPDRGIGALDLLAEFFLWLLPFLRNSLLKLLLCFSGFGLVLWCTSEGGECEGGECDGGECEGGEYEGGEGGEG